MKLTKLFKTHRNMLENDLKIQFNEYSPKLNVFLRRLKEDRTVPVNVYFNRGDLYIYDLFKDKEYGMKRYGKDWALIKEDCLWRKRK